MKKMTMSLDEALLARVMRLTGLKTKTETVKFALWEAERTNKLTKFLASRRLSKDDLKDSVDPAYDLMALRMADVPKSPPRKSGSR